MVGRPPGKSKRRGIGQIRTAGGLFGKRPAPPPPPHDLPVQDDEPQLDGSRDQEDKGGEKDDSSGSEHSNGTPEDLTLDGTTRGQTRPRKTARRGEKHQQGSRTPRCVDERSDDLESGGIVVGGCHDDSGDDSMSSHDSDFELTNYEEDEEEPQGEEGPQPLGGARESLPPRASAAAAGHESNNTKEQREKRRSAEEKRAARAAALRERRRSTPRRVLLFSSRSNCSNWTPSWSTRRKLYPPTARKSRRIGRCMPSCPSCLWS